VKSRKRRQDRFDEDGSGVIDDDSQPLLVPRNVRALVPMPAERVWRLRKHLVESLLAMRRMKPATKPAAPPQPELEGFTARVAVMACTMCKGWCCKGGGEHAYLDERTMARVQRETPGLGAWSLLQSYVRRSPKTGYEGSCVFHGEQGCTLDRSQRSDVCNSYFCGGLGNYVTRGDATKPVVVMAGEASTMRTSPVLKP